MIHEGKVFELGCPMLAKHHLEIILDDGKLDDVRFDYLVVGVAKIRVRVNSSSDKSDIWTKTSYPNPIWITNRTFWPDPDPDPDDRCPEPIVWICNVIFEHYDQNLVWPHSNPICNVRNRLSKIVFINFSRELRPKLYINLIVWCLNLVVWLSKFIQTRNDSKIWTTRSRPEFKFKHD